MSVLAMRPINLWIEDNDNRAGLKPDRIPEIIQKLRKVWLGSDYYLVDFLMSLSSGLKESWERRLGKDPKPKVSYNEKISDSLLKWLLDNDATPIAQAYENVSQEDVLKSLESKWAWHPQRGLGEMISNEASRVLAKGARLSEIEDINVLSQVADPVWEHLFNVYGETDDIRACDVGGEWLRSRPAIKDYNWQKTNGAWRLIPELHF